MKLAVVLGCNIHWTPYYYLYERLIKSKSINFDLIIWNRENLVEKSLGRVIPFNLKDQSCDNNPRKVYKFFLFANFVKKIVEKNKYDKIVFLGLQGCALPLNAFYFSKNYKNMYWIDVRDYHYEWFKPYYMLEKYAIHNAKRVSISSEGFKSFLPKEDYIHVHNVDPDIEMVCRKYLKKANSKIRISFIGNVRYLEENKKLVDVFANDKRFILQFIGNGSELIGNYCKTKGIENIVIIPKFPREKTIDYYNETDIINNIYGNKTLETKTALSNKLYYSIFLKIPIIVSEGTYMSRFCSRYGFGISFKDNKNFKNELYEWYLKINKNKEIYEKAQQLVSEENETFEKHFVSFLDY